MTMSNIVAGFRTTGVYPLDPSACSFEKVSEKDRLAKCESLAERSGLHFIPLYSPAKKRVQSLPQVAAFDAEQMSLFQKRFEEGYDLPGDECYQQWLRMYHPEGLSSASPDLSISSIVDDLPSRVESSSMQQFSSLSANPLAEPASSIPIEENNVLPHTSFLSRLLADRLPSIKYPTKPPQSSSRVLTSGENLAMMHKKEAKKMQEAKEKAERKIIREQKRVAVQREKEKRQKEKELSLRRGSVQHTCKFHLHSYTV